MSDPNVYLGIRNCSSVSVTDLGVDNTGATDAGAQITASLARFASGQEAWFPAGTYKITSTVLNPNLVTFRFAQDALFTGANASSVTNAAAGSTVRANTPSLYPATAISQILHETVEAWRIVPSGGVQPYQCQLRLEGIYNGQPDPVLRIGFNVDHAITTLPAGYWSLEENYESVPGTHIIETYFEFWENGVSTGSRPFMAQYVYGSAQVDTSISFADSVSTGPGSLVLTELSASAAQFQWTTNNLNIAPPTYTITYAQNLVISGEITGGLTETLTLRAYDSSARAISVTCDGGAEAIEFYVALGTAAVFHYNQVEIVLPLLVDSTATFNSTAIFAGAIAGNATPLTYAVSGNLDVTNGHSVSAGEKVNPYLVLTGTMAGNETLTLPNSLGARWHIDLSGVVFGGNTLSFSTGTGTSASVTAAQLAVTGQAGVIVGITASNKVVRFS